MKITSTAPMRVDLAGGTLDIFPLYLFEDGASTINAAVGIRSRVVVEARTDRKITICSKDLDMQVSAENLDDLVPEGPLDLVIRAVKYYRPICGINVTTDNNIPKGSGLGASSALLIALSHALTRISGQKPDKEKIISIGANIEAQSIRVPTGKQDYYPASYGGISAIHFGVEGVKRRELTPPGDFLEEMEDRTVLCFVGEPRFSGTTNWDMMKGYIDGNDRVVKSLKKIKEIACKMKESVEDGNWMALAQLLREEWDNRVNLAPGVTNPDINRTMGALRKQGALACKLCGAGGGGCMLSFTEEGAKPDIERYLKDRGILVLPFKIERRGVKVVQDN
ncbi:MAG: GHMP kinase [Pseudomonadota bacterium]